MIINSKELEAQDATAKISGSGNIIVFASQSISTKISGSGHIHVYGNPQKTIEHTNSESEKTTIMTP